MVWGTSTSRQVAADLEVLASSANADLKKSIVLDASAVTPDPVDGVRRLVAGTLLEKVGNQYARYDGTGTIAGVLALTEEFPDNTNQSDTPSSMWNHGQEFRADRIVGYATYGAAARAALPTCRFL